MTQKVGKTAGAKMTPNVAIDADEYESSDACNRHAAA